MSSLAVLVRVPEATVDENNLSQPGQYQVRPSWELVIVEAIAESHSVNKAADNHFRLGTGAADLPHILASFLGR
jgi:hypothetical protein